MTLCHTVQLLAVIPYESGAILIFGSEYPKTIPSINIHLPIYKKEKGDLIIGIPRTNGFIRLSFKAMNPMLSGSSYKTGSRSEGWIKKMWHTYTMEYYSVITISRPRRAREGSAPPSRGKQAGTRREPGLGPSPGAALRRPKRPTGRIPRPAYQAGLMSGAGNSEKSAWRPVPWWVQPWWPGRVCAQLTAACRPGRARTTHPHRRLTRSVHFWCWGGFGK